ncbi:unnamed protein product [Meloidogyne enterolobii]|uniref:Uncharacterized protein n=1 Tax=Meloidogyne enterolobii TaxID=390850 RepID=A0ACB0YSM4_MELEN
MKFNKLQMWQTAIERSIPLFLNNFGNGRNFLVCIEKASSYLLHGNPYYILKLPNIPKNIEEIIIIRCWLEQLLKCAFVYAFFNINVLNPEMINILFHNDKSIKFNFQKLFIFASDKTFESVLKFSLNHLTISESLHINLDNVDIIEKYTKILYNILINEGNKFPKICLRSSKLKQLYNIIIEVICLL